MREKYIEAGEIARTALVHGAKQIKVGASLLEVTKSVEKKVLDMGGEFAFPPQISLNEVAAHYCAHPDDDTIFKKGDLAKIDVGVMIDGYIGDNAMTVDLGDNEDLVKASREALNKAIEVIRPGVTLGEIGRAIQETISSYDYAPVRNLSGHGLEQYEFHAKPSIPNFDTGDKTALKEGQVIAIEPFASSGSGVIFESTNPSIFSQVGKKPVRNVITRKILKKIETFNELPFTTRWLADEFGTGRVKFALRELQQKNIITAYPPLPDNKGGLISQAEHTVIVEDEPLVTTKQ